MIPLMPRVIETNDGVTALDEFLAGTIPSGSIDLDGNEDMTLLQMVFYY